MHYDPGFVADRRVRPRLPAALPESIPPARVARGAGIAAGVLRRAHLAGDRDSPGGSDGVLAAGCGAADGSAAQANPVSAGFTRHMDSHRLPSIRCILSLRDF